MPQETEMDRVGKELAQQARSRIRKRKMMYEGSLTGGLPTTLTPKPSLSGTSCIALVRAGCTVVWVGLVRSSRHVVVGMSVKQLQVVRRCVGVWW